MKIVIAGGTGFIGQHLSQLLLHEGHSVIVLSRQVRGSTQLGPSHAQHVLWDGCTQGAWTQECDGADVVVNVSGAPIANSRWTEKRKQVLIDSRVQSTQTLLQAISSWRRKPHTYISASGIGIYGDCGGEVVNESSIPGKGFLSQLCQMWERTAMEGEALGLRVIAIRIGMVLGANGGALSKMIFPFRMFLGGPILPGSQFVSWIHLEDLARLILFLITHPSIRGPVNAVAPDAVTMNDFCMALGKALGRPSWFPVPGFILQIILGELANMLTTGQRVQPQKALGVGFSYTYTTLQGALNAIVAQPSA